MGGRSTTRSDEGDREGDSGTQSHRHRVGSIVTYREVKRRADRVVHSDRTDEQIATARLAGHGQVARNGDGTGGYAGDCEGSGGMVGERTRQSACAAAGVEDSGGRESVIRGTGRIGGEVAGHIEDGMGSRSTTRSDEGDREAASGTQSDRHRVGSIVAGREVEGRASGVVHGDRTDEQIATACLPGHGQVAGNGDGTGGYAGDGEGSGDVVCEGTRQSACAVAGVEDASRREGVVGGERRPCHRGRGGRRHR